MNNPQLSRRALLTATGTITAAALLAGKRTAAASTAAPASTAAGTSAAAAAAAVSLITLTAKPAGKFARVRAVDDDTRLYLTYPSAAGPVTGRLVTAPAYYGLDIADYPADANAAQHLQDLFDNTPFGYLGFYFKTTGHPGNQWTGKSADLLAQGWDLLPIYVGRQQIWNHTSDNQISANAATAKTQGTADGKKAVTLADTEKLPGNSRLYLDIEPVMDASENPVLPSQATIEYIKAWVAEVKGSGKYLPGLYDSNQRWPKTGGTEHRQAVDIHTSLGADAPATWVAWDPTTVPAGVEVGATSANPKGSWPLDPNGDIAAVAVKSYSSTLRWNFAAFAEAWQFQLDWTPPAGTSFLTDTGAPRTLTDISGDFDLNAAKSYDPGNTAPGKPKAKRRPVATAVTAAATSVQAGKTVKVTVKLDRPAAAPNGAVVLLRTSSPHLILPSSARVAAKATSVTVTATAAVASPAGSATVTARTLYQLSAKPAQVTLRITT
jgi:hypothetical protein